MISAFGKILKDRFRKEYLAELVHRGKLPTFRPIRIGDVVLIGLDNCKCLEWPLAGVLELISGKNSIPRIARLKLSSGELIRPIQQLYLMEAPSEELEEDDSASTTRTDVEDDRKKESVVATRGGCRIRKSIRFTY